jgi:transcriptional regulator with XRE-family HTH domain
MDTVRLGRSVRILRHRRGWRQVDLSARAGVARGAVSLLELGRAGELRLDVIERIGRALEARVIVRVDWRGEAIDRLLDSAHAALVDDGVKRLLRAGWVAETEVSFEIRGERGSIDILAWHPLERILLVVEVKSAFGDLQATLMVLDRKVRLAPLVARRFGWEAVNIGRLLVVGEGRTARRIVETHTALFESAFPIRGRGAIGWLAAPTPARFSGLLFSSSAHGTSVTRRQRVRRTSSGTRKRLVEGNSGSSEKGRPLAAGSSEAEGRTSIT